MVDGIMLNTTNYYGPGHVVAFSSKSGNTVYQNGKMYRKNRNGTWKEIVRNEDRNNGIRCINRKARDRKS